MAEGDKYRGWLEGCWPHQAEALPQLWNLLDEQTQNRVVVTSPTGGGKTRMMMRHIEYRQSLGKRLILYTDRRMLLDQTARVLTDHGIWFGIRASGMDDAWNLNAPVQLAMVQTESTRKKKRAMYQHFNADDVLIDEAHKMTGAGMQELFQHHMQDGANLIGWTATPLDLGSMYSDLIIAGTNKELRACGAHVPCKVFAPDEPGWEPEKKKADGEFSEKDAVKAMRLHTVFGRIFDTWKQLNPAMRPTIIFAPGVKESIWIAKTATEMGIRTAHIDGERIIVDGEEMRSTSENREWLERESREGRLHVSNRFVLREGIDMPWLYHGILATLFGSVTSYLQSVGRLLRAHPSMDHVILQDHGANFRRHGSPNEDRVWNLRQTAYQLSKLRENAIRDNKQPEPIVCKKCGAVRNFGPVCPTCGTQQQAHFRRIIEEDGTLREVNEKAFVKKPTQMKNTTEQHWKSVYYGMRRKGKTFGQAYAWFCKLHGYRPPKDLPLMPKNDSDWFRKIQDVPPRELR